MDKIIMSCIHKFNDIQDFKGLIPNWDFDKLIIGTFNPSNDFHESNTANFFYQRKRNYFWDVFPLFYNSKPISKDDTNLQKSFLKTNKIGITDILISINDAKKNVSNHIQLISTVKDDDLEKFRSFNWNTKNIINIIHRNKVKEVYFTKLGLIDQINVNENTFEYQIRIIENYCKINNIYNIRLHSPTGMGLGEGKRVESLKKRWENNGL
jgi:hypothetical protein